MVYLYGIIHGGHWENIILGRSGEMNIIPTKGFIEDLTRFSKGTKIGFEYLTKQNWDDVQQHIRSLPFNPPRPRFKDGEYASRPIYAQNKSVYWNALEKVCSDLGFDITFLEDKNIWFKYNETIIRTAKNNAKRTNLLVKESGESEEHYFKKLISFNSEEYKEEILTRKIHEIERDDSLLRMIKSSGVEIAVVGLGHSDYWMANPQLIMENFGVNFGGYSVEMPMEGTAPWGGLTKFAKDAKPNPLIAFERQSLERAIRLLENKGLTERKPDFIGTWDVHSPSAGYFEMFIDGTKNGKIKGEIVDCLGDADFEGVISNTEIKFLKEYKQDRCSSGATKKEITYKALVRGKEIMGFFEINGFGQPFYATSESSKNILDLSTLWRTSTEKYREDIKILSKRFFEPIVNC